MTSISSKLLPIRDMLVGILPDATYHYFRKVKKTKYIIWAEDAESDSFGSDNTKQEQQITGTIDLFTKTEYDSTADSIQDGLNALGIGWALNTVQYEEETNLIHYEWSFWVA